MLRGFSDTFRVETFSPTRLSSPKLCILLDIIEMVVSSKFQSWWHCNYIHYGIVVWLVAAKVEVSHAFKCTVCA